MEIFSALLALCAGNSPVNGEFPSQRPVTRSFDVLFDLRLNKQLNKWSWGWWFETPSRSLWRHCNEDIFSPLYFQQHHALLQLTAYCSCYMMVFNREIYVTLLTAFLDRSFFLADPSDNLSWLRQWNAFRITGRLYGEFTGHRWIPLTKGQ